MLPPIFAVCAADPAVTALLGSNPLRLWPYADAGHNPPRPYAVWRVITGSPENFLAGRPDMDGWTLQVDVYAATDSQAEAVAEAIRHAIELRANVEGYNGTDRDPETLDYHIGFDVDWFNPR